MKQYQWQGDKCIGAVTGNVWSRSARRKAPTKPTEREGEEEVKLGFRIQVKDMGTTAQVDVEWRWGRDVILFESFCGKIKGIVQVQRTESSIKS